MNPVAVLNTALAGRYAIEREIGAGGMATVYLARDLKHDRHVALKVLRPELGAVLGTDRFLSEIRVTANLQHPHLLPLFDSGEAEGLLFYVMPYVEGESLRDRLNRERQLPVDEALRIATAVASALNYAHKHQVIHRDLKPENILLQEGQPVVSDFGIALAVTNAGGARITQTGLSLGTPQYMSPEQATGDRQIDARTDIYSLAVVLYEMLVGDPPHTGSTVQGVIAKVLTDKPRSVRATRESVPEHVEFALEVALAKLPADRWSSAGEFADALNGRMTGLSRTGTIASRAPAPGRWSRALSALPWALVVLLLLFTTWRSFGREPVRMPPAIFELTLPPDRQVLTNTPGTVLALSPDGTRLAYSGSGDRIYLRELADLEPRALPGTERGRSPFFSPDGEWLGFVADNRLKKISLAGGAPIALGEFRNSQGASWGDDGQIVVASGGPEGLVRISEDGGDITPVPMPNRVERESARRQPFVLPGSKYVLYTSFRGPIEPPQVAIQSLETGEARLLGLAGSNPQYARSGYVVVPQTSGNVLAVPFDLRRARLSGGAFAALERVIVKPSGAAVFSVANDGTIVYAEGNSGTILTLVDGAGRDQPLLPAGAPGTYQSPRFSPDGRRIAYMFRATMTTDVRSGPLTGVAGDIWIYDVSSRAASRLTFVGRNSYPEWTHDGKRVTFPSVVDSTGSERNGIYSQLADGSTPPELLVGGLQGQAEGILSHDGRYLVYREMLGDNLNRDIGVVDLAGDKTRRPLLASSFQETAPRLSPDGRWLAYISDENGPNEIYVRPFPGLDGRWQVSTSGGTEPQWSASGRELHYWNGDTLIAAAISAGASFSVTGRRNVYVGAHFSNTSHAEYDLHPKTGAMVHTRPVIGTTRIIRVENWLGQRQRGKRSTRR